LHGHHIFVNLYLKSWTIYLTVWITGARCTVPETARSSGCAGTKITHIIVVVRHFTGYKYLIHLVLITISQFSFLSWLVFTFLVLHMQLMEDKRCTKHARSSSKGGSPSSYDAKTPPPASFGSLPLLMSPSEVSSHCPCSPVRARGILREGSSGGLFRLLMREISSLMSRRMTSSLESFLVTSTVTS
jgi:hypothetical protein